MAAISRGVARLTTKQLRLENYNDYCNYPSAASTTLASLKLNEILHLHGYFMLRKQKFRKGNVLEALSGIENLLNPLRSTLSETLSSGSPCLTVDEVNADLTALKWQEDFPLESFQTLSATTKSDIVVHDIHGTGNEANRQKKKDRKGQHKVFDAVHTTKPRSKKNCPKRKRLSDVIDFDRISASLG